MVRTSLLAAFVAAIIASAPAYAQTGSTDPGGRPGDSSSEGYFTPTEPTVSQPSDTRPFDRAILNEDDGAENGVCFNC